MSMQMSVFPCRCLYYRIALRMSANANAVFPELMQISALPDCALCVPSLLCQSLFLIVKMQKDALYCTTLAAIVAYFFRFCERCGASVLVATSFPICFFSYLL